MMSWVITNAIHSMAFLRCLLHLGGATESAYALSARKEAPSPA